MDDFRPTIVATEMVGNRRDSWSFYSMRCTLEANPETDQGEHLKHDVENDKRELRFEHRDENDRWIGKLISLHFRRGEGTSIL